MITQFKEEDQFFADRLEDRTIDFKAALPDSENFNKCLKFKNSVYYHYLRAKDYKGDFVIRVFDYHKILHIQFCACILYSKGEKIKPFIAVKKGDELPLIYETDQNIKNFVLAGRGVLFEVLTREPMIYQSILVDFPQLKSYE